MAERSVTLGFILKAVDQASKPIEAAGGLIEKAMHGAGEGFHFLHHALRTVHMAMRMFHELIGGTIEQALKFRDGTDPAKMSILAMGQAIQILRARVGDTMIPVLQSFTDVLKPIVDQMAHWFAANQKVIASGILEWSVKIGEVLVKVVLVGADLVGKTVFGWRMIFSGVKDVFDTVVGLLLAGFSKILGGAAAVANAFGMRDTTVALTNFQKKVDDLSGSWSEAGDKARISAAEQRNGMQTMDGAIDKAGKTADRVFNQVMTIGLLNVANATTGADQNIDKLEKTEAKLEKHNLALQQKEFNKELAESIRLGQHFGDGMGKALGMIAAHTKDARTAFKDMANDILNTIKEMVIKSITAHAGDAAAGAAASQAAVPIVGPGLAVAAAAAMFSFVVGLIDQAFHTGGVVGEGVTRSGPARGWPGLNSREMPILAEMGEEVLTRDDPRHRANLGTTRGRGPMARFTDAGDHRVNRFTGRQGDEAGTVNLHFSLMTMPTRSEWRKIVRQRIVPELQDLGFSGAGPT